MPSDDIVRRAFRVAYRGDPFHGFQRQPDVPTVESALFGAVRELGLLESDDVPSGYSAAGRTDAGVSALAQTIAFDCPTWLSPRAFNSELPRSVRVWAMADVPPDFHAMRCAIERGYTYFLYAPMANAGDTERVAARLSGEHDFRNLTPDTRGVVRNIQVTLDWDRDILVVSVTAPGFPRQLVRRLVTLIDRVLTGELAFSAIDRVLSESTGRDVGIGPAPPYGLVLRDVRYDISFIRDDAASSNVHDQFTQWHAEWRSRAHVARTIADGTRSPPARGPRNS